jgi:hypothetical protein
MLPISALVKNVHEPRYSPDVRRAGRLALTYARLCASIRWYTERSPQGGKVPESQQSCPSCRRRLPAEAFYANCAECKTCKRKRSQNNRALQARKIAAFERFVEALIVLADKTGEPDRRRELTEAASA